MCTTGAPPPNLLVPLPVSGQRISGDGAVASLTCLLGECARGVHVQINSCFCVSLHNIWTPLGRTVDDHIRLKHTFKTTLFSDRQLCSNDSTHHYKQPESCQLTHRKHSESLHLTRMSNKLLSFVKHAVKLLQPKAGVRQVYSTS